MTNDEKFLRQHIGEKNPFKVPEGYFENLVPQLMERLPDKPATAGREEPQKAVARVVPLMERLRPLLYVAATLFVAVFTFSVFMQKMDDKAEPQLAAQTEGIDEYFDEEADYVMFDNYDIYACLTSE